MMRTYFDKKRFGDVLGYNSGVGLLGPPLMTAWCYLLDGVMIDSGITHLRPAIVAQAQEDKPEMMLITHHHEDHSGNVGAICRVLGMGVAVRARTSTVWRSCLSLSLSATPKRCGSSTCFKKIFAPLSKSCIS